jgi:hypothetical protein
MTAHHVNHAPRSSSPNAKEKGGIEFHERRYCLVAKELGPGDLPRALGFLTPGSTSLKATQLAIRRSEIGFLPVSRSGLPCANAAAVPHSLLD